MANDKSYTDVLLEVHDRMDTMERRILRGVNGNAKAIVRLETKVDGICVTQVRHEDAIDNLKARDRNVTIISTVVASITGTLAGLFGPRS
jgi:hypothetical protein